MEIFDGDSDGVYELVQFDSCFRYFMEDCGSCSPEPRAYFRYDAREGLYKPTKGIVQDFVKEQMASTERWIEVEYRRSTHDVNAVSGPGLQRSLLSHVVDLIYIGEEAKAWRLFGKYADDSDGAVRREIKKTLKACKFYKLMRRS
ncbi:MAG TPA: hypothetical protein VNA22_09885 [Pyrinomonadaceae bacterium]|nr:hypothetical protein [Pyrinomonadaceae bacterium]